MMYTPRARAAFQHQQFFFEQKAKLSDLLNNIGRDAKTIAGQQTCMDVFELTTVITQLLEEAQLACTLTFEQIERYGVQMQPFAEKVQMVETVAAEVHARALVAVAPKAASCKRGRAVEEDDEDMSYTYKRTRGFGDYVMVIEPAYCGPYADRFLQSAWWTQPVCE